MDALEGYKKKFRRVPKAVATDKGYGSLGNAQKAKALGVRDLTFSRKHLAEGGDELVAHGLVEKMLLRFRAGAEAIISAAKRGVNLSRCLWHGWEGFCSYVWSSIAAHNLKMMVAALR